MISLFAVDLTAAQDAWEQRPLDALVAARPRGRVATLLSGPVGGVVVDGRRPAAEALRAVDAAARADVFLGLVEDLAHAAVHDVPDDGLNAALAVLARISERHELALDRLQKRALPAADACGTACVVWPLDADLLTAAVKVLEEPSLREVDLPEARVAGVDRGHILDVLDSLRALFTALRRHALSLLATRYP